VFLVFGGEEELVVMGYTNASFQTDTDDSKLQSSFVFASMEGVSWKSSKQDIVADSTTEARYIPTSKVAKEVIWIKNFVSKLGVAPSASSPMDLYCDNCGAVAQEKVARSQKRSKLVL
jgi:hypothetical protein